MPLGLSIHKCFPDPLSGNWPSTHHPVLCECRQLYTLVSICCCIPSAHLLVLHDGPSKSCVTSMPRGPTYLELNLTESTRPDTVCAFFTRADSTTAPSTSKELGLHRMDLKVVILRNIAAASPQVMSAVMDVLISGFVRTGGAVKRVPRLRIVAFCDAALYASALPEYVRQAFALSTYMSSISMESPAVIQSTDSHTSNVVNRLHMAEVMFSSDGAELIESVTLASSVSRYLRHLIVVLRGSMLMHSTVGVFAPSRLPLQLRILRVAALLFADVKKPPRVKSLFRAAPSSSLSDAGDAIANFSHVILSPSDVMCLLCPLLAHLFSVRREMARLARGPGPGPGAARRTGPGAWRGDFGLPRRGGADPAATDGAAEAQWDAHALQWIAPARREGDAAREAGEGFGEAAGGGGVATSREASRRAAGMEEEEEAAATMLSYPECRELIRLTIIRHSAPPPG